MVNYMKKNLTFIDSIVFYTKLSAISSAIMYFYTDQLDLMLNYILLTIILIIINNHINKQQ